MIPENTSMEVLEKENGRMTLGKFERSKILQVYFARLDGRYPQEIPPEYEDLYTTDLSEIKNFLLNQYPQDSLLQKIFKMIN